MKPLRTGILGCGGFAHRHAENLISLAGRNRISAFSDHHEQNARGSQKDMGGESKRLYGSPRNVRESRSRFSCDLPATLCSLG